MFPHLRFLVPFYLIRQLQIAPLLVTLAAAELVAAIHLVHFLSHQVPAFLYLLGVIVQSCSITTICVKEQQCVSVCPA